MKMIGTEERERKESKCMAEANLLYINTGGRHTICLCCRREHGMKRTFSGPPEIIICTTVHQTNNEKMYNFNWQKWMRETTRRWEKDNRNDS